MTEYSDEPPKNGKDYTKLPQELLDMVWDSALEPWLRKRVIILNSFCWNAPMHLPKTMDTEEGLCFSFECANPTDVEASELVGNIRRVNRRARNTVSRSLSKAAREMFPERPDLSRKRLGVSFRAQHADFKHDVFWLSRGFLDARFSYILHDSSRIHPDMLSLDPPQPLHMMLSLRHMMAIMEMVILGDTPCLGRRQGSPVGLTDALRDFHRVVQINRAERLRTLTVLLPQSIDEYHGKVDLEVLEYRPFGRSVEEKKSVLELARTQSNRSMLDMVHLCWSYLVDLANYRGEDLPTLQFSRPRS